MDCFLLKLRALVVVQTLDRCAYPYQKMADKYIILTVYWLRIFSSNVSFLFLCSRFEFLYFAVVFSILRLSHGLPVSSDVDTTGKI